MMNFSFEKPHGGQYNDQCETVVLKDRKTDSCPHFPLRSIATAAIGAKKKNRNLDHDLRGVLYILLKYSVKPNIFQRRDG